MSTFAELGLPRPLISALIRRGIDEPFPIQKACVPDALTGRDVLGCGQTGSGKTLAFGLPLLARVAGSRPTPKRPRGLILVPTRELAMQVQAVLEPLGRGLSLRTKTAVGGTSLGRQIDALRRGVDVLVATPGRLTDLIERRACSLGNVMVTVIDEADHMADLGFLPSVAALLDQVPADGQRLLFSATLDRDVDTLVDRYLADPVTHAVTPPAATVQTMEHHLLLVQPREKFAVATEIANRPGRTILFVRTQRGADRLALHLSRMGVRAAALHGGMRQNARTRALAEFREGGIGALVATDVAARGIHVDDVSLILHVDPPADHKDYLHRAGRTARAGAAGVVAMLALPHEVRSSTAMTRRLGISAPRTKVAAGHPELVRVTGARPLPHPAPGDRHGTDRNADWASTGGNGTADGRAADRVTERHGGDRTADGRGGDRRSRDRHPKARGHSRSPRTRDFVRRGSAHSDRGRDLPRR